MSSPTPLRRELLTSLGILFGGVTLLLGIAISLVLPFLRSTGEATIFILVIAGMSAVVVLTFGGWALKKNLLDPVDELVEGVKQIADGDYRHRLDVPNGLELRSITESVNQMADRLIAGQEVLAENVRSLDETNVMLVEARNEVIQAARLASVGTLWHVSRQCSPSGWGPRSGGGRRRLHALAKNPNRCSGFVPCTSLK